MHKTLYGIQDLASYSEILNTTLLYVGKWTVQQAAELSVAAPTIEAALDARFLSGAKDERVAASKFFEEKGLKPPTPAKVILQLTKLLCRA